MTADSQKSELLEEFQHYLQQANIDTLSASEQPDLHTLLSEMTGLKTEVKAESRQFKNTLDSLNSALQTVQEDNQLLSTELASITVRFEQQQQEMMRIMLLEIIDIYSRMNTSLDVLQKYQPVTSLFKNSRKKDIHFIEGMTQGQRMMTKRFEQLLQGYHVKAIDCVGNSFDPKTMSVLETCYDVKLENGLVVEELRKGFFLQDKVLRLAEVKVNKVK